MIIKDEVYGSIELDGVLEELAQCSAMQRLKHIHQGGAAFLADPRCHHTRFQHSLGVTWLVKRLQGSLQEQVAALLHDISHTAFSHMADYVFGQHNEDYHEQIYERIVNRSDIPAILKKHGIELSEILTGSWNLLERPLPHLCADRLDYTLRDLFHVGMISRKEIDWLLSGVQTSGGRIVLKDATYGEWLKEQFRLLQVHYFMHPRFLAVNTAFAALLKYALSRHYISEASFLQHDDELIALLKATLDEKIMDFFNNPSENFFTPETEDAFVKVKLRNLEPEVSSGN